MRRLRVGTLRRLASRYAAQHGGVPVTLGPTTTRILALHLARYGALPPTWDLIHRGEPVPRAVTDMARHIRMTESWPEWEPAPCPEVAIIMKAAIGSLSVT